MPTFATDQEMERLEAEREAWGAYRAALGGLEGREYEEAEVAAWEALQRRLAELPG
jgi:hypothetical protein